MLKLFSSEITSIKYLLKEGRIKIVICTKRAVYSAKLAANGKEYRDCFNVEEPYDRLTHIFYIPVKELNNGDKLRFCVKRHKAEKLYSAFDFEFSNPVYENEEKLKAEYDSDLRLLFEEKEKICGGVEYIHKVFNDKNNKTVHSYITVFSPEYASLYVGTPYDGYKSRYVRATIPDMIKSAENNGVKPIVAVNADFFDIFGDFHPSGICVKNGIPIANTASSRPFIALLNNGKHIITDIRENPDIVPEIRHAAAGMQLIVKNSEISDYAPLEPFGYVRHPRTAVGITGKSEIIFAVVDGRIPKHSNGASLVDLAKIMLSMGAERAINMDGGGSSAMYIKKDGTFKLCNRPADLFRPNAMLIRKDFNSLIIEKKQ